MGKCFGQIRRPFLLMCTLWVLECVLYETCGPLNNNYEMSSAGESQLDAINANWIMDKADDHWPEVGDRYFGISVLPKVKIWYRHRITEWLCKFTEIQIPKVGLGNCSISVFWAFLKAFMRALKAFMKAFWVFEDLFKAFLWPFEGLQSFFLKYRITEWLCKMNKFFIIASLRLTILSNTTKRLKAWLEL